MTDISGNVTAMSGYTIGSASTDTITYAQYVIFLAWAQDKVSQDNPGFSSAQSDEATALLICHSISRKTGVSGKISESIGNYSYTRARSGLSSWMDEYKELIANARAASGTWLYKVNR